MQFLHKLFLFFSLASQFELPAFDMLKLFKGTNYFKISLCVAMSCQLHKQGLTLAYPSSTTLALVHYGAHLSVTCVRHVLTLFYGSSSSGISLYCMTEL